MVCFVPSGPTSLLCIREVGWLHEDSDELVFQWHSPTHIQHRAAALSSLTLSVSSCRLPANAHSELTLLPVGTHRGRNPGTTAMRYVWDGSRVTAMDESLLTQMTTASGRVTQWASGLLDRLQRAFLPDSKEVTPDYWEWLRWRLTQRFFSSTMQNLSTQSLLLALGMGAKRSIAAGAAINWLLKDGVGRVARMAVATNFGQSFDSDLKRIRFKTSLIFEATIGCEFITPFFPQHFLLLASVANVGKAIALAAFVATAPAFQQSLCNGGNLADLTAKNQAQHMVVDMLALAVSAGAMWWAKNLKTPALLPLLAFPLLASGDLYSIYRELKSVQLYTLNRERAEIIAAAWLSERRVPLAAEVSQQERLLFPSSNGHALPLRIQPLSQLLPSPEALGPLLQQYADSKYLLLVKTPQTGSPNHHTSAPPLPHPSLNTPPAHQPNRRSSQRQTASASHSGQPLLADSGQGQQGAGQPALLPPLATPQLGGWLRGTRQPEPHIAVSLRCAGWAEGCHCRAHLFGPLVSLPRACTMP
ncbi:vitamin B6 photo-protection and homoeostasis-domain-containing protein [Haematococcus lacustris]